MMPILAYYNDGDGGNGGDERETTMTTATTNLMECRACGIESEAASTCPVCGTKVWNCPALDELTRKVTAAENWADLVASMDGGYVPTLRPATRKPRGKRQLAWENDVAMLAAAIRAAGYRVFDGTVA